MSIKDWVTIADVVSRVVFVNPPLFDEPFTVFSFSVTVSLLNRCKFLWLFLEQIELPEPLKEAIEIAQAAKEEVEDEVRRAKEEPETSGGRERRYATATRKLQN